MSTVIKRGILVSADLTEGLKTMAKVPLKLVAPTIEKRTVDSKVVAAVRPGRRPNAVYRTREHLTETEVEKLIEAAKGNRWGHRDATMVLVAYRHGLRASELVDLQWTQVELCKGDAARAQSQERHPCYASDPWRRAESFAPVGARAGSKVTVRVHLGTRLSVLLGWIRPHDRAGWRRSQARLSGSSPHAASRLRLRSGQCWARYKGSAGLSRAQEYPAHGQVHRVGSDAV